MSGYKVSRTAGVPNRGPSVLAVTTATLVLAFVFVVGRLISRARIVRQVTADDYIIVVAWVFALFLAVTIDLGTTRGLGRHDADIPKPERERLRICIFVFSVLYNPGLMIAKTSILVFYLRLAKNTQKIMRMASWACLGVVNLAGAVLTLLNIFQCQPVSAGWGRNVDSARCIPILTEFVCSAPVNIITDLTILALPIPVLTGMRLPRKQKIILVLTFSVGIFVTVVDVVRIYYLQKAIADTPDSAVYYTSPLFADNPEFSWNASLAFMWSAVEVNVGIVIACVPMLKPLIIRILPAMLIDPDGTRTRSRSRNTDSKFDSETTPHQDCTDNSTLQASGDPLTAPQEPPPAQPLHIRDSDEISIRDFLAAGDGAQPLDQRLRRGAVPRQTSAALTAISSRTQGNSVYFGFVNMKRPRSMLRTSASESWKYCTAVTILFFLWGFNYGLLNSLNSTIANIAKMTEAQTLGLNSIYFGGGYFFGPLLVGEWLIRHDEHQRRRSRRGSSRRGGGGGYSDSIGGFRITFIVGLIINGIGSIAFWPSAVLTAFGGFMFSNFVVGFGLGVLETAANPFLALCGPMQYSEMRLCLAQGVQAVASVLSELLAQRAFFVDLGKTGYDPETSLIAVQWTYLAATLFCGVLALLFYYMPLPEVLDGELELLASKLPVDPAKRSVGGLPLRNWTLALAVLAQWAYVAVQESMGIYFGALLTSLLPASEPNTASSTFNPVTGRIPGLTLSISDYLLVAHTAFAVSRFAAGYLSYLSVRHPRARLIPTPRTTLAACAALSAVLAVLVVVLRPRGDPNLLVVPMVLFHLAEGPLWPLIFALGLRGQGKRTKRAGAWLTMGASGPAFWPFVIFGIVRGGASLQTAFVVVVVLLVVTLLYPLFLSFVRDARTLVDPAEGGRVNVDNRVVGDGDAEREEEQEDMDAIVAARQKGSKKGRGSGRLSWGGRSGGSKSSAGQAAVSPATTREQQHRKGSGREEPQEQKESQTAAPWDCQELDTTILEKP